MENQQITDALIAQFGADAVYGVTESHGILQFTTGVENIVPMFHFLYAHPVFKFQFLTDLAGIHFPDAKGQELGVIYHLHSLENNVRLMMKLMRRLRLRISQASQVYSQRPIGWSAKPLISTELFLMDILI